MEFQLPLFALQLQIRSSGHAVPRIARCHHQMHHRLQLWDLLCLNEPHNAQLALLQQSRQT